MSDKVQKDELGLRYLREIAAILIAAIVLIGFIMMMRETYSHVGAGKENDFNQTKDLLQIFTGFLGIVIGYYFNRVSTEARAEKAETAASNANDLAQGAVAAHQTAVKDTLAANNVVIETKSELRSLTDAAKNLLANSVNPQTRGAAVIGDGIENDLKTLQNAVERAERIL